MWCPAYRASTFSSDKIFRVPSPSIQEGSVVAILSSIWAVLQGTLQSASEQTNPRQTILHSNPQTVLDSARRTVNSLAVPLLLAVEDGVLVLGAHLLLLGHLSLPPLHGLGRLALLGQRAVERRDDRVDRPEAEPLPPLLELGQPPGRLPQQAAA